MNGNLLRETRKRKGFSSRSSFVKSLDDSGKPTVSLSTLQRAEGYQKIDLVSAKYICDFLDQNIEYFLISDSDKKHVAGPKFAGEWYFFFIECDVYKKYRIHRGLCRITNDENGYSGVDFSDDDTEKVSERIISAKIIRNVIMGETIVEGAMPPYGCGQFMATFQKGDDWLEGISTWYDRDTDGVESTRDIWIRKGCPDEDALIDLAMSEMEEELKKRHLTQSK